MGKTNLMIALIGVIIIPLTLFSGVLPVPKSHRIMAIITTEDLLPAADSFSLWHNALGETTYVYTVSSIYNGYFGRDRQEKIRVFIQYLNQVKGINTIMILGDTSEVPIRQVMYAGMYNDALIPTDLYYADLEGNWDANGNGIFGEYINGINVDNVNGIPDVVIGRIPLSGNEALIDYYHRMVEYQTTMPILSTHFWGASINDVGDGIGQIYCLQLKSNLPQWIDTKSLFNPMVDTFTAFPRWVGDDELNRTNAINDLNSGNLITIHVENGGFNWLGTGYICCGDRIFDYNMKGVKTDFYITTSSYGALPLKGSVGYAFLAGGGLAYIGNTSIGNPEEADSYGRLLNNLFSDSTAYLGEAFDRIYGDNLYFDYTINYLGDPLLRTYSENPSMLNYNIKYGTSVITINTDIADVYVSLIEGDSIVCSGFTDGDGNISIPFYRYGSYKVVLSKKGYVVTVVNLKRYNGIKGNYVQNVKADSKLDITRAKVYNISGRYMGKYRTLKTSLSGGIYIVSDGKVTHKISLVK
ncbi:MAG: hypothetical protein GWP03_05800 [Proteobacteria bacterium]|nr:hypothetical protein [Pseudomonadota bacterium]